MSASSQDAEHVNLRKEDDSSDFRKFAPKWLRDSSGEQAETAAHNTTPSFVRPTRRAPTSSTLDPARPHLESELRRRVADPDLILEPHRRDSQSAGKMVVLPLMWRLGIAVAVLAGISFLAFGRPFLQSLIPAIDTVSDSKESARPSNRLSINKSVRDGKGIQVAAAGAELERAISLHGQSAVFRASEFEQRGEGIAGPVRGITNSEIRFGMAAPFSGAAKELGRQMKLGIETAFNASNTSGGVNGRQLRLVAADDGYEPARTAEAMKQLYDSDQVFGLIGNVGTPTAVVALPYSLERKMLFYGAFTGAGLLRRDPPDRYVFNYRASYAEETDAVVHYLVKVRQLKPEQIAVFAQQDAYGDAGFAGVARAMRALRGGDESTILRLDYKRNTIDVDNAVAQLQKSRTPIKAVVMVATYRAAARFIEKTRDLYSGMIYTNVSFVGSTALASELMLLGAKYADGVIVTQVVPALDGYSSVVLGYKAALTNYFPGETPDYVSFEGYIAANILIEALKRNGPVLDTERLVDTFENIRDVDLGLGTPVTFAKSDHQGVHKVWATQLDSNGHYQPFELQ
jgi:branched-chain amino acid transport system substrate-binding protein